MSRGRILQRGDRLVAAAQCAWAAASSPPLSTCRHRAQRRHARRLDRAARARDADVRHHDRHRRLHRQRRGQPQLLRPADARVPGLQRGAGLRARDRRQGQRAGGAAGRAGAAVVGQGAGRAGHEHRPVPVGRGPLQAHARHLGGVPGLQEPVLDPDQVAAAAARSGPDEGDREGHGDQRVPVGARRWTRRRGVRRSRTRRTRGRGSRPWRSSTATASRPAC